MAKLMLKKIAPGVIIVKLMSNLATMRSAVGKDLLPG